MTFQRTGLQPGATISCPDHLIGEILTKRWTDNAIPFLALVVDGWRFRHRSFQASSSRSRCSDSTRQLGEFSIVVTGLTIVMLGGGIDLSVGSIFALSCLRGRVTPSSSSSCPIWVALARRRWPPALVFGAINGYLVGYLRLRAFLTTLVTFIIGRGALRHPGGELLPPTSSSPASHPMLWDFIGDGTILRPLDRASWPRSSSRSSPISR